MAGGVFFGVCFTALAFALVVCFYARPIADKLCVMDVPDGASGRKRHASPTPLVGGLAIMGPVILALLLFQSDPGITASVIALVSGLMLLVGFFDDRRHLDPLFRLLVSATIIGTVLYVVPALRLEELYFSLIPQPFKMLPLIGGGFTLICLLGLQNAVNMADGKNGLVIGLAILWTLFLLYAAPAELRPVLVALLVALGVTFPFNAKGRLFLGDAGSYSLSVLIGLLSIYVFNHSRVLLPADLVALWFLVPILDCVRLIWSRIRRGRAPFSADRNHLHHLLYDAMAWRFGLPIYLSMVGVPGTIALIWPEITSLLIVLSGMTYGLAYVALSRRQTVLEETR